MNDTSTAHPPPGEGGAALPLLQGLTPESVYRGNAFRVIGASVRATPRDITRRADRLKLAEQVGHAAGLGGPLPLATPADGESVREALRRVRSPEHRLLDELFWFWPAEADGRPDPALTALERGDTAAAVTLWREDATGVGAHNLAVLYHAIALDLETAGTTDGEAERRRDRCWKEALAAWKACFDNELFWRRFRERIRELDDPRLSVDLGRKIRDLLPVALLGLNARLALAAAESDRDADADRHVDLIDGCNFGSEVVTRALELVLSPLRERILTLCRAAEPAANAAPEKANEVCLRLLEQTAPLLAHLSLLPERHPVRESAHDEVAHRALQCQIAYGNKTTDWKTSLALLNLILPVCASESAKARVTSNIEIVKGNVEYAEEYATCFFCKRRPPEDGAAVEVKLHGNVERYGGRVTWTHLTAKVPRCPTCKSRENRATGWAILTFLIAVIVGITSCNAGPEGDEGIAVGILGAITGGIAAAFVFKYFMAGSKSSSQAKTFSAIKQKLAEGWAFGEKPPGVQ